MPSLPSRHGSASASSSGGSINSNFFKVAENLIQKRPSGSTGAAATSGASTPTTPTPPQAPASPSAAAPQSPALTSAEPGRAPFNPPVLSRPLFNPPEESRPVTNPPELTRPSVPGTPSMPAPFDPAPMAPRPSARPQLQSTLPPGHSPAPAPAGRGAGGTTPQPPAGAPQPEPAAKKARSNAAEQYGPNNQDKIAHLRAALGDAAVVPDETLRDLLQQCDGNVDVVANLLTDGGQAAGAGRAAPAHADRFEPLLVHFETMGFSNRELNLQLLHETDGDVEAAVNRLLMLGAD